MRRVMVVALCSFVVLLAGCSQRAAAPSARVASYASPGHGKYQGDKVLQIQRALWRPLRCLPGAQKAV